MKKSRNASRKIKTHDGGRMWRIPPQPPQITVVPWYNLTVRILAPAAIFTTVNLQAAIAQQLNISFETSVCFVRLQKLRIWGALSTTANLQQINVIIYDPIQTAAPSAALGAPRILEQYIDFPDQVNRARVGYVYPKAQREASLQVSNSNPSTLVFSSGLGASSVMYVDLQWRSFNTSVTLATEDFELEESLDRSVLRYAQETLVRDKDGIITNLVPAYYRK